MKPSSLDRLTAHMEALAERQERVIVALDGMCASGKTTLAVQLAERTGCPVFHVDDFYLPFSERTPEILAQPGGNIDLARLYTQVLAPLRAGEAVDYIRYDCQTDRLLPAEHIAPPRIALIEGAYCLHPQLRDAYDLRVFLATAPETQLERLRRRESPESYARFLAEWIPGENAYFSACAVRVCCHLLLEN